MAILHVERIGGFAGFGTTKARIRSIGQVEFSSLSEEDQKSVETLFQSHRKVKSQAMRDGFRYRISRTTAKGTDTVEVAESELPEMLVHCVKDEFV